MQQNTQLQQLGYAIARYRSEQGFTQAVFAERLNTSQSAIARIERGEQNLTTEMIHKISQVLNRNLVSIAPGTVDFQINGGGALAGSVTCKTAKNSATALLAAALLNDGTTTLKNMPRIEEVRRIVEVLQSIGVSIKWSGSTITVQPPTHMKTDAIDTQAAQKTRSIIMLIPPLAHRFRQFTLPRVGGCKLGNRSIRPHVHALEALGIFVRNKEHTYAVTNATASSREVILPEAGDTVTENALMAAAKIPATTTIKYASANYQVQDLCFFLEELGIHIEGIGTSTLTVHGVESISADVTYTPSEDPTEAMFFLATAAVTHSSITIQRCPIDFLELELWNLRDMGFQYTSTDRYAGENGRTSLVDITTYPSDLVAREEKIFPLPYPGLNIDNLPFFAVIATQASGTTLIHDWVYEGRAIHYTELNKLGAETILADPHRIYISGPTALNATDLTCPPALRPAAILLIGMLAADGSSVLRNVYSINRGYEDLVDRLNQLGADVTILSG